MYLLAPYKYTIIIIPGKRLLLGKHDFGLVSVIVHVLVKRPPPFCFIQAKCPPIFILAKPAHPWFLLILVPLCEQPAQRQHAQLRPGLGYIRPLSCMRNNN